MRRLRPVTLAMLWYPLVCVLAAGALGAWLWLDCGDQPDPVGCRAEVGPGTLLFLGAILVVGLGVLAALWVVTKALSLLDRGEAADPVAGFARDTPSHEEPDPPGEDPGEPAERP